MGGQAIDAPRFNGFNVPPESLTLVTEKGHALYSPDVNDQVDDSFIQNIMALGIVEPVVVTKDGNKVLVVDGRKRVKAAVEASKRLAATGQPPLLIPVVLKRGDEASLTEIMVSLNEIRKEDNPLTKACKAKKLLDYGRPYDQIARAFGVTQQSIRNWLSLLDLDASIQKRVAAGTLSVSAATPLAGLSRNDQVATLAKLESDAREAEPAMPRVKAAAAAKAVRAKRTGKQESEFVAPSKPTVRRLLAACQSKLSTEEVKAIQWMLGEGPPPAAIAMVLKAAGG